MVVPPFQLSYSRTEKLRCSFRHHASETVVLTMTRQIAKGSKENGNVFCPVHRSTWRRTPATYFSMGQCLNFDEGACFRADRRRSRSP